MRRRVLSLPTAALAALLLAGGFASTSEAAGKKLILAVFPHGCDAICVAFKQAIARSGLPAEIVFDTEVSGTVGTGVTILGRLDPQLEGEPLNLTISRPDGSVFTLMEITTETSGQFQHTFEPDSVGDWEITVTWPGNDQYEDALGTLALSISAAILKGDVNDDGSIRSNDAILALRISVGLMIPTDEQEHAADMNDDGRIRSNDAIFILRKAVGLPVTGEEPIED